jgi:KilA-N domain
MITKPVMKRDFYDSFVCQRTKDGFFNATEFLNRFNELSGKELRLQHFFENQGTQEFLKALDIELLPNSRNSGDLENVKFQADIRTHQRIRGNKGATWMHPYLFVKFAMWLSPALEVKIIKWVYDHLIEFRLLAGDHYKEMCDAVAWRYFQYYKKTAGPDVFMDEAHLLNQLVFGNPKGNQRDIATEKQLDLMNRLQVANIKMIQEGFSRGQREKNLRIFKSLYE